MCDVCGKEFKGWCKSFSRSERALTILEAVLLLLLIVLVVFLILHLLACSAHHPVIYEDPTSTVLIPNSSSSSIEPTAETSQVTSTRETTTDDITEDPSSTWIPDTEPNVTTKADLHCTWTPSHKTAAWTHYFENVAPGDGIQIAPFDLNAAKSNTETTEVTAMLDTEDEEFDSVFQASIQSDQLEDADKIQYQYVMGLVKKWSPTLGTFGCILTVITNHWVLTAASCIQAIQAVHTLDSFVMVQVHGTSSRREIHSVIDIQIHPLYRGVNMSYDLAALKSDSILMNAQPVELASVLEHALITIGERFDILGFEDFRSAGADRRARGLRLLRVYSLSEARCGRRRRAPRHLSRETAPAPAPAAAPPLCAGAGSRDRCRGTPLLRGGKLFGVMVCRDGGGAPSESHLYVSVAAHRRWIHSVVDGK